MDDCLLSQVVAHLSGDEKKRYIEKVKAVGAGDPYLLPPRVFSPVLTAAGSGAQIAASEIPAVTYGDLYNYLIRASAYTEESLKAFKSLDAYKYFVSGFVHDVIITKASTNKFIVIAKVSHSQRLNDPALRPWVACDKSGQVLASHCTCKAGLGEVCSHVAATLFFLEAVVKKQSDTACTSLPCEWIRPSSAKGQYKEAFNMNFSSIHTKKRKLDAESDSMAQSSAKISSVPPMTEEESKKFLEDLRDTGTKCGVLALVKDHAQNFVPVEAASGEKLPNLLTALYCEEAVKLSDDGLKQHCEEAFKSLTITNAQAAELERLTRKQSKSKLWYQHRAGRVTASKFKSVLATSLVNPAKSLVKQICYPSSYKFSTEATRWGCKHEDHARNLYSLAQGKHINFQLKDSGLHVHPNYPFLGASPDGMIRCDCCGEGVLEIKCPFCKRGMCLDDAARDAKFCLAKTDGILHLKREHAYYYQIQGQMLITNTQYCDFVVWTDDTASLHTERVCRDEEFIEKMVGQLLNFFKLCILPELVARRVLSPPIIQSQVWCYCRTVAVTDDMVQCSSKDCKVVKFHLSCLGLKRRQKTMWTCLDCRKLNKQKK